MRYPALASLLTLAAASTAHAAPTSPLHPLVPSELPASCRDHAAVPTTATTVDPDFAAHVSVASCLAETAMADLALQPDDVSLTSLDVAAAPSLEILEDVRAHGEDHWKAIADDRKADLLLGMVVRMRIATNDPMTTPVSSRSSRAGSMSPRARLARRRRSRIASTSAKPAERFAA